VPGEVTLEEQNRAILEGASTNTKRQVCVFLSNSLLQNPPSITVRLNRFIQVQSPMLSILVDAAFFSCSCLYFRCQLQRHLLKVCPCLNSQESGPQYFVGDFFDTLLLVLLILLVGKCKISSFKTASRLCRIA
jgi:hypothetical protein